MKTWVYQQSRDVAKFGDEAPWFVGYYDLNGKRRCKSFGPGDDGRERAKKAAAKIETELYDGTHGDLSKQSWAEFRERFIKWLEPRVRPQTLRLTIEAMDHFEEIAKPKLVKRITTSTIDDYVSVRSLQRGKQPGSKLSPATVNRELRHLRAVFNKAADWGYMAQAPQFDFRKQPRKLPTFISPDDFVRIYDQCTSATLPSGLPFPAADWWRALLIFAFMTGWRIKEILSLRRDDLDLDGGFAVTGHVDNKGGRDERVTLPPIVVSHLREIRSLDPFVFPLHFPEKKLYAEFAALQKSAKVKPPRGKDYYAFHDLRRGFATANAKRLHPLVLQRLMRHKAFATTQGYIDLADQFSAGLENLFVPDVANRKVN